MKRIFYLYLLLVMAVPQLHIGRGLVYARTTYYVSSSGNNANNGTSIATPWRTPNRINSVTTYLPGDSVLFRRGDTFEGQINVKLQGTPSSPIVIGAYGTGAKPIIFGDMRQNVVWTKTPGTTGIYQAYVGPGTVMANNYCHQWVNGAWVPLNGIDIRSSDANRYLWPNFYAALTEGRFGRSYAADTLFVHTYGNVPMPATRDSIRMIRNGNAIQSGSHDAIVRDLDIRNINYAIEALKSTNIIFRQLNARKSMLLGIAFDGCINSLIDSCYADSGGSTQIYLRASTRCKARYNTVKDVTVNVDGVHIVGDKCAIGIQGPYYAGMDWTTGYGYNTVEYNLLDHAGPIDFWYNVGDTIQYNTMINTGIGIYPHGTNLVIKGNRIIFEAGSSSGMMHGMNMGTGTLSVTDNVFIGSNEAWIWLENDSAATGGKVIFSNNIFSRGTVAHTTGMAISDPGTTLSNNHYYGLGGFSSYLSPTVYRSLAEFQKATGFETGSTWSAEMRAPTGTITASPSILPWIGGATAIQWTSSDATAATLRYRTPYSDTSISVALNGSMTVNLSAPTTFQLYLSGVLGSTTVSTRVSVETPPTEYSLEQNFPNPFTTGTTIAYTLPSNANVSLKVFDILGYEITTIVESMQTSGPHQIYWTPQGLASGVYRYRLTTGGFTKTRRMVIVQ